MNGRRPIRWHIAEAFEGPWVLIGSVATFFVVLFTAIALMARAGKIQPKEPAR